MKKLVVLTLVAAAVSLLPQQASAWCNFKFGVGLNLEYSGGDNSFLWGFHTSGPYTGGPVGFPPHGGMMGGYGDFGGGAYEPPMTAMNYPPMPAQVPATAQAGHQGGQVTPVHMYNYYQPVSYQYQGYYPGYYYQQSNGYYYGR